MKGLPEIFKKVDLSVLIKPFVIFILFSNIAFIPNYILFNSVCVSVLKSRFQISALSNVPNYGFKYNTKFDVLT